MGRCRVFISRTLRASAVVCALAGMHASPFRPAARLGVSGPSPARGAAERDDWEETSARARPTNATPCGISDGDDWLG